MFANSVAPPLTADAPSGSRCPRVAAARRLLIGLLAPERANCDDSVQVLGVEWLQRQGLAPLAWSVCRGRDLSADLQAALREAYYAAAGDAELHRCELEEVLHGLNLLQIQAVVFKGAALAYGVYADPAFRTMGDLDLWVQAEVLDRACQALEEIGYQSFHKPDRPPALMALFQGEIRYQSWRPEYGLVELHWGVFPGEWLRRAASPDSAAIHRRIRPTLLVGERAHILAPEDAILQSAVHTAVNHQMSMSPLRAVVDIVMLARHYPIDWNVVVQRARDWRVATPLWLVLNLTVDLAGLDEAAEAVRQLQPSALRRRLIRRFANAETLVEMRDLSASKWRYVFLLLLVDRRRDAVKLVFRALWPERAWLIARYGRYTFSTRLRHLFDAAQGRI
jgi:hypothetical protein